MSARRLRSHDRVRRVLDWHRLLTPAPADDILDVVDRSVAVAATATATPYVALHARLNRFTPALLDHHLYETRELVKVHAFRGAFFLVRRPLLAAILRASAPGRERVCRAYRREHAVSESRWRDLRDTILKTLGGRAMGAREVAEAADVGKLPPTFVRMLSVEGSLVQWTPLQSPSWESAQHRWAARAAMFPEAKPEAADLESAQADLLRRYLEAYGPASVKDAAWWLDATARTVDRLLAAIGRVTWVEDDDTGQELVGIPARVGTAAKSVPPVFVPAADHVPRAYRERSFFLSEERYDQIVTKDGNFRASVWVDGEIRGRWGFAHGGDKGFVIVWMFGPFPPAVRKALAERAHHMGAFHGYPQVSTLFTDLPSGWPASSPRPPLPWDLTPKARG